MNTTAFTITLNAGDLLQIIGSIIVALIGAVALLKSSNSNVSDKISRTQWAFEMYISFLGVYLSTKNSANPLDEDYKKYKAAYYIFYAYADEEIKKKLYEIDKFVNTNNKDAKRKLYELIDYYCRKYNVKQYGLKSKARFFIKGNRFRI